ncbi:MAG: M12 family metallo-peptidase [Deltaproteobacteria bacterium]|nr:M12 family metallo-peptidase [Deltaproteobacteria bacterium]
MTVLTFYEAVMLGRDIMFTHKMRMKIERTCLLLLCIVLLSFSAAFAAEFSLIVEPEGHQAVMQTQKAEEKGLFRSAARWRRVDLLKQLALTDGIAKGDELVLNLFPDTSYHATVDRVSVNAQGTISIRGRLRNYPLGYVLISTTGDLSLASIHVPELGVEYTIVYDPDSRAHYLLDHDPLKMDKLEDSPAVIPPPPKPEEEQEIKALQERILLNRVVDDSTATVEVMVIYTPAARIWANSNEGSISNVIAQAMEKAQLVADNSGTQFTVHLIHSEEVAYTENGDSGIDLDRLQGSADGYLDAVHAMRNTYAADLVVLVTKTDDTGGIGYLLNSPSGLPAYAFSITRVQQASWTYTTIHEIGHNMGLSHHKTQNVQPGPGLYSYSAGWRWVSTDGGRYCSIMTYESGSYFSDGMKHTRVPYFSNPSITYIGAATGHATNGDNARTVREIKNVIAAYRQATPSCTYAISPTSSSFSSSGNTGAVTITTSSSSCSWTATSNNTSWIAITAGSAGTGNGTVFYSVSANTGSSRTGTMTIGERTFTVTQNGAASCTYTLSPTSASFSSSGNTGAVTVSTSSGSCFWSAISNDWWITVTAGSTGTGNGAVYYSVSANTGSSRTGTMTIGERTFTVTQNGAASCTYTLSPTSASFSSSGNTGTVTITTSSSSCSWTATSNASWITITSGSSGIGAGTLSYSVESNAGNARRGNITVTRQTFTVTQSGGINITDFNNSDILWRNASTGENVVWYMNGVTFTGGGFLLTVPDLNWEIVGTGDFNSDGHTDVLWRNASTGENVVWYMNGVTFTGGGLLLTVPDLNWEIVNH